MVDGRDVDGHRLRRNRVCPARKAAVSGKEGWMSLHAPASMPSKEGRSIREGGSDEPACPSQHAQRGRQKWQGRRVR
eukprot:355526-Chlamydomonas_euryale.AAC.2